MSRCWFNVGPTSEKVTQHQHNVFPEIKLTQRWLDVGSTSKKETSTQLVKIPVASWDWKKIRFIYLIKQNTQFYGTNTTILVFDQEAPTIKDQGRGP